MVQGRDSFYREAALGVAVYEFPLPAGFCDYMLFIDGKAAGVLEYFHASIIGLTATLTKHTLGFFDRNLVADYLCDRSVADGVNLGYEVYRIRTEVTEDCGKVETVETGF